MTNKPNRRTILIIDTATIGDQPFARDDLDDDWTSLHGVTDPGRFIVAIHRFANRLDALRCEKVGEFDRAGRFAAVGALSMNAWLRHQCNLNRSQTSKEVLIGRRLPQLPAASESFEAGAINIDQASLIGQTLDRIGNQPYAPAAPHGVP